MLRSLKDLERYTVSATDGDIGSIVNFLLDDERWAVRYLVLETGGLLDSRRVLVSPTSFREIDSHPKRFHLALTKEKLNNSPAVDANQPVSRQHERDYYRYHGYAPYWGYSGLWGVGTYPGLLETELWHDAAVEHSGGSGDVHLRRASEVRGYHIQGSDDTIGHVDDFIVDDETWQVRYLVIDTSNWWFGKKVLVAPHWATRVSWEDKKVFVNLSRHVIKNSPEWDASSTIERGYESRLHEHYSRPLYWDSVNRPTPVPPPYQSPSSLSRHGSKNEQ